MVPESFIHPGCIRACYANVSHDIGPDVLCLETHRRPWEDMNPKDVIYASDVIENGIKIGWRLVDVKVGQRRVAARVIQTVNCARARQRGFCQ